MSTKTYQPVGVSDGPCWLCGKDVIVGHYSSYDFTRLKPVHVHCDADYRRTKYIQGAMAALLEREDEREAKAV